MEPFPFDVERLNVFLLGMTSKRLIQEKGNLQMNVTPFVRVPATGAAEVRRQTAQVLNAGVFGVMYPSISTREEAEYAVRAMRKPQPYGTPAFEREPAGYVPLARAMQIGIGVSAIIRSAPTSGRTTPRVSCWPSSRSRRRRVSPTSRRSCRYRGLA